MRNNMRFTFIFFAMAVLRFTSVLTESDHIICRCGKSTKKIYVPISALTFLKNSPGPLAPMHLEPSEKARKTNYGNETDFRTICDKFRNCRTCSERYMICSSCPNGFGGDFCNELIVTSSYNETLYPKVVRYAKGSRKFREKRDKHATCNHPSSMKTAEVECTMHKKWILCKLSCVYGYTQKEGIEVTKKCAYDQDVWEPSGWRECRPFVDCSLKLQYAGSMSCTKYHMYTGPQCDVKCYRYEDKDAVLEKRYSCDINGKWSPSLPFCVEAGTGMHLVSAPKIKSFAEVKDK